MRRLLSTALAVGIGTVFLMLPACDGDEPTNGNGLNVAGTWTLQVTEDGTACGDPIENYTTTLTVTQSGNNITVATEVGTFSGTLSGSRLTWSGSYPEDGGITTESVTVTFSGDGNSLQGSSTWSWTDGTFSCTGTTTFSGVKG